ncbi:hypothetical protein E2C01_081132 [Portunus trituberculatus]|uniref:Uncharacterized protein n=1 Tax=Portunus trituberculatus TaxID=210409 RepID=A0A5B7IVU1_PORTR|nr:hypothetical protein [Portunus trituberculatus]
MTPSSQHSPSQHQGEERKMSLKKETNEILEPSCPSLLTFNDTTPLPPSPCSLSFSPTPLPPHSPPTALQHGRGQGVCLPRLSVDHREQHHRSRSKRLQGGEEKQQQREEEKKAPTSPVKAAVAWQQQEQQQSQPRTKVHLEKDDQVARGGQVSQVDDCLGLTCVSGLPGFVPRRSQVLLLSVVVWVVIHGRRQTEGHRCVENQPQHGTWVEKQRYVVPAARGPSLTAATSPRILREAASVTGDWGNDRASPVYHQTS